ncbi:MAG TPA: hypothetical protein VI959_02810, partial [Alphaproteobacteria bacterium]|nr:hypothetical protein [Alphaproteobacteria bacterium]
RNAPHVWAGAILLKNSVTSRQFIKDWLECCKLPGMLQGVSKRPPYEGFVHHQHDEGILGVVAAKEIKNVHYIPIDNVFYSYMRMHRRKDNSYSLLGYTSSDMLGFEKKLLEKPIFKQIRKAIQYFSNERAD